MKNKINVNTKLTAALKEKVDHTKPLVEAIRKKHNEFIDYWLVCYSAESFKALDLFEPYLAYASLNFCPSNLYHNTDDSKSCYESTGKFDIPEKFSDGPMFLGLSHQETYGRDALFIPTACLTGRNADLYETLKKYTPKPEKRGNSQYDYFPNDYYSDSYSLSNRMRSEVTHAVVLWESTEGGDYDITVRWIRDDLGFRLNEFITVSDIFNYLWDGVEINPFNNY